MSKEFKEMMMEKIREWCPFMLFWVVLIAYLTGVVWLGVWLVTAGWLSAWLYSVIGGSAIAVNMILTMATIGWYFDYTARKK